MNSNVSRYRTLRNLAFFFMLGFLVYHVFDFRPIFWRLGLVAVSLVGLILHLREFKFQKVEKYMLVFIAINVVYFLFSLIWQSHQFTYFGDILCATLPMFLFAVLSAHGVITQRSITIFLLLSTICGFFYFSHAEYDLIQGSVYGESGDFTVNASTIFLVIIPLLFFVRNRWLMFSIMVVIVLFIVLGAKRGNIVAMIIPLFFVFRYRFGSKNTFLNRVLVLFGFFVLAYLAYRVAIGSDYLMGRINDTIAGDSSNRDIIYSAVLNAWLNANDLVNYLFGFGSNATINMIGIRAHNDWLEILLDFGLLGICLYLAFFVSLFKTTWRQKENRQAFYTLMTVFAIWFFKSLYSMGFNESLFSYLSMVIGIVLGDLKRLDFQEKSIEV